MRRTDSRQAPTGTGAWKSRDATTSPTGAKFVRNDAWWGGKTPLDSTEFIFFDDTGPMVTAYQGGQIDAIVQFDVLSGAPLFDDTNFTVVDTPRPTTARSGCTATPGQFADKRVRQALAYTFDRPALIQSLFKGRAHPGQRPRHLGVLPVLQRHGRAARPATSSKAKQLLADAGVPA